MQWMLKKFEDLDPHELYAIVQLRNLVFAVEQNCVYPDLDNRDQDSFHLMCWSVPANKEEQASLLAYTRLLPPGLAYDEPSIGRVVTATAARKTGLGRELMNRSIAQIHTLYGKQPVRIGAQLYLLQFYQSLGFSATGAIYLEDGIEHIEMLLS